MVTDGGKWIEMKSVFHKTCFNGYYGFENVII